MSGPEGLKARENMIKGMFTPATPPAVQEHVLKMMLAAPEATASRRDARHVRRIQSGKTTS